MKKVLIIGATGSLAQYVIEALKVSGKTHLTLFSRSVKRLSQKLTQGCEIIQGDATNFNEVMKAVERNPRLRGVVKGFDDTAA